MNDSTWQSARENCEVLPLHSYNRRDGAIKEGRWLNCWSKSNQEAGAERPSGLLGNAAPPSLRGPYSNVQTEPQRT